MLLPHATSRTGGSGGKHGCRGKGLMLAQEGVEFQQAFLAEEAIAFS